MTRSQDAGAAECWVPGTFRRPATGTGPLDGCTLAVKDMLAIEGHVSSFGHPRWRDTHGPATQTAPAVTRLLAAGASIAGLAKLDQLAWSIIGNAGEGVAPRNPVYPDRFTGGSSSGPAAAVAAGLASVGIGTDTGGSVRVPAAACGIFGLRPTHGLISTDGVLPLAPSLDTVGILTGRLAMAGQVLRVLAGDADDDGVAVGPVVLPADCLDAVSERTAQAVRAAAEVIARSAGCALAEMALAGCIGDAVTDLFARVQSRQVWAAHGPWLAANSGALAPDVAGRVRRAEQLSAGPAAERDADVQAAQDYRAALAACLPAGTIAVLPVMPDLTPLRTAPATDLQAFRLAALRFTAPASLAGRPQLVIPVRHAASGTSLGVGLLGWPGSDASLLAIAAAACPAEGELVV
jgi:amidase